MNAGLAYLRLLLSDLYPGSLAPDHLLDLQRSALSDETIRLHRIRSVPPAMISRLLGYNLSGVLSAYVIPFPDPAGGFMDHIRIKIFPSLQDNHGRTVKYLQPRRSSLRLFFPLLSLDQALAGAEPLWLVEGEKKALAVAQLGLPAVGFCGIEAWHLAGTRQLLPDFAHLCLRGRVIEVLPDGDWRTNLNVLRGVDRLLTALETRGSKARLVALPQNVEIST